MSSGGGGSFISKPARGWLHADNQVTKEGITYAVRYIGCLEVYTSMKSLDFETRSCVAKECINRVCEAAGLKSADKKRRVDRKVLKAIADKPRMEHAGANINLIISSCSLALTMLDTGAIVAKHDMPRISFASGGDTDTLDFVAYIAKNLKEWRACYVLECGGGLAQDVIATIGQAFELRFKEFLTKPSTIMVLASPRDTDRDYYNDLPGKVPPDIGPPPVPPLPINASTLPNLKHHSNHNHGTSSASQIDTLSSNRGRQSQQWPETGNLIDLSSEASALPSSSSSGVIVEHNYVNDTVIAANRDFRREQRDAFDMQPFNTTIPDVSKLSPQSQKQQLKREIWFHGSISRAEAESMLTKDGDFLVRESQGSPGQYVLTGMNGGTPRHLLLIDPEGVVRTKDRVFDSVSHLINDHCDNALPIISADSTLVLRYPVPRRSEQTNEGRK